MLRQLTIQNFVLIDRLDLALQPGFTAITGETGSGKSILLHALGLLKGDRADFSGIGQNGNRSVVEGVFAMNDHLKEQLQALELEIWNELVVRREIQKDGRSRAFINDTPVGLQDLKGIMNAMLVIHSQYNTLELRDKEVQQVMLDAMAGTTKQYLDFRRGFKAYLEMQKKRDVVRAQLEQLKAKQDYDAFLLQELESIDLLNVDYNQLILSLAMQEQKQFLLGLLSDTMNFSEGNAVDGLRSVKAQFQKTPHLDAAFASMLDKINEILTLVEDLGFEASRKYDAMLSEAIDAHDVLEKVDEYNRLLNKHKVNTQEALQEKQVALRAQSDLLLQLQTELEHLEESLRRLETEIKEFAAVLNKSRKSAIAVMETKFKEGLSSLKLKDATLSFQMTEVPQLNERGMIELELLFSANKGMEPTPIHKVASGGELSRVMLLLQQLVSEKMQLPCILFDEIDTGVSGDVAERIGKLLYTMGKGRQLFAITHLPQVASKAQHHLLVTKSESLHAVNSEVVSLNPEERIREIARLLSGEEINPEALRQAQHLMG